MALGLWFRPDDLSQKSALSELKGVYVPFWTFDAATHSAWTAEAGFDYQVAVQVEENGRWVTRYETRTRWEPAEGVLEHVFDDVPVPASKGLPPDLARVDRAVSRRTTWSPTSRRTSRASSPRSTRVGAEGRARTRQKSA